MILIRELTEDVQYIREESEGKKKLYVEGPFLQGGIKNRNGRIYPMDILDREVERYIRESVNTNRALGELSHPPTPQINLERVSHRIISLKKEGNNYIGKALVIDDAPMGKIAAALINAGSSIGVSSRGLGTLKLNSDGINEVQSDFTLATAADFVTEPSAPDAWINGIYEGVEFWFDKSLGQWVPQKAEQIREELKKEKINEDVLLHKFKEYLKVVGK